MSWEAGTGRKRGRGRQWDFLGEARDRGRLLNVPDSTALPTAPAAAGCVAPAERVEGVCLGFSETPASRRAVPHPGLCSGPPRRPRPHPGPRPHQVLLVLLRRFQQPARSLRALPRRLARLPAQAPRHLASLPLQAAEGKLRRCHCGRRQVLRLPRPPEKASCDGAEEARAEGPHPPLRGCPE